MIKLEPFSAEDFERLISWIPDRESLVMFAGTIFEYPLTPVQLGHYMEEKKRTTFRVRERESGKIIGHAEILRIGRNIIRLCRILIGEKEYRGKGYGSEIISVLLEQSFLIPQVQIVELNVYSHNYPAIKCYESAGFRRNPSGNRRIPVGSEHWLSLNMVMYRNGFIQ